MDEKMTFGQAIDACRKENKKIKRTGWNDGEIYVEFNSERVYFVLYFLDKKTHKIVMRVAWSPSQKDLVSEDWEFTTQN